ILPEWQSFGRVTRMANRANKPTGPSDEDKNRANEPTDPSDGGKNRANEPTEPSEGGARIARTNPPRLGAPVKTRNTNPFGPAAGASGHYARQNRAIPPIPRNLHKSPRSRTRLGVTLGRQNGFVREGMQPQAVKLWRLCRGGAEGGLSGRG